MTVYFLVVDSKMCTKNKFYTSNTAIDISVVFSDPLNLLLKSAFFWNCSGIRKLRMDGYCALLELPFCALSGSGYWILDTVLFRDVFYFSNGGGARGMQGGFTPYWETFALLACQGKINHSSGKFC